VLRQKSEIEGLSYERFVRRDVEIGEGLLRSRLIKAALGPRRGGKSVFSIQGIKDRRYAYLNFDEEQLVKVDNYDVFLKGLREVYGSFDVLLHNEVQNLSNWELLVNRLQRSGLNLIITGSSSRLLGSELASLSVDLIKPLFIVFGKRLWRVFGPGGFRYPRGRGPRCLRR